MRTPARGGVDYTSIYAYREIIDTLGARQKQVLTMLMVYHRRLPGERSPTAAELEEFSKIRGSWKRLSELVKAGAVHEGPAYKCRVTGHLAKTWQLGPGDDQGRLF